MIVSIILSVISIVLVIKMIIEYRQSKTINEKIIFWIVLIAIFFPIIMYYLDYFDIPSKFGWTNNLKSSEWLNVIFTYVIGLISAIIGAFMTIHSVQLTINTQEKSRINDNQKQALPLLKVEPEKEYDYRYKYIQFDCLFTEESKLRTRKDIVDTASVTIKLKNVGMRELYDLYIGNIESSVFKEEKDYYHKICPIIYKDDCLNINLMFYEMGNYDNDLSETKNNSMINFMSFNCYFKDCYNNWYYQTLRISLMYNLMKDVPTDKRALNISVSNTEVISPPISISEKDLPWNNNSEVCCH